MALSIRKKSHHGPVASIGECEAALRAAQARLATAMQNGAGVSAAVAEVRRADGALEAARSSNR